MTQYFLITSAQNSTPIHEEFWRNLLAYRRWLKAELLVGRFVYNVEKQVADSRVRQDAVYCKQIPLQEQKPYPLAPGLVWHPEMNILPTAVRPLSGLDNYGAGSSAIFPHAKLALESIPTGNRDRTNFNYTTGACTVPHYIQKKAGLKAQFHHITCALIVEVADDGRWWVRQLNADSKGNICDLTIRVSEGSITQGVAIETISWGDIHGCEIDPEVQTMNWAPDAGIIDWLRPKYQFMHDLLAWCSASHWDRKSFDRRFKRWWSGITVEKELTLTAELLGAARRQWCQTVVVNSNHDTHPERWLDEANYQHDLPNAEVFLEAQLARLRSSRAGLNDWQFLPWAMDRAGCVKAQYLGINDSFVLGGVEYGWHGHLGPNGARGSSANLARACRKVTKGHDHKATIRDGTYSGGVCNTALEYAKGPSSWSVSHVVQYQNRKRAILTTNGDQPWAEF